MGAIQAARLGACAIAGSPQWFPLGVDPGWEQVAWVRLGADEYRAASFLDGRSFQAVPRAQSSWAEAAGAVAHMNARVHFIFHIGHVGSTLLSRLVGECADLFALREPLLLRALADRRDPLSADRRGTTLKLLSRSWRPGQLPVIKATSLVSEIADELLASAGEGRALLMFTSPLSYLRGIFAGPASRQEAAAMAPSRLQRLATALDAAPSALEARSEGERIAMSWLCEMTALGRAAQAHPARVFWLDFDSFLQAPAVRLGQALALFGVRPSAPEIDAILAGPITRRYSKGPEHGYDATLRARLQVQAEQQNGAEIRRGMDWLGRVATAFPLARHVLETSARHRVATPSDQAGTAAAARRAP